MNPTQMSENFHPEDIAITPLISVKRSHGLGNVICLLPVLDRLSEEGCQIQVITRPEWTHAFSVLRPAYTFCTDSDNQFVDLDQLTQDLEPTEHRTDEFGRILGLGRPFSYPRLNVPPVWTHPFENLKGCLIFAPEAGHPSRQWPNEQCAQLPEYFPDDKFVLVGTATNSSLPCDLDLRGQLELHELFGLLAVAGTIITMDSAILHIAAALGQPTVAIFGGINPGYRVRSDQPVVTLQSKMDCCPCNKNESCQEKFPCISAVQPQDVVQAVTLAHKIKQRHHFPVSPQSEKDSLVTKASAYKSPGVN